jgi:hypothetical protein
VPGRNSNTMRRSRTRQIRCAENGFAKVNRSVSSPRFQQSVENTVEKPGTLADPGRNVNVFCAFRLTRAVSIRFSVARSLRWSSPLRHPGQKGRKSRNQRCLTVPDVLTGGTEAHLRREVGGRYDGLLRPTLRAGHVNQVTCGHQIRRQGKFPRVSGHEDYIDANAGLLHCR